MLYISETYLFRLNLKKVGKTTRPFRYDLYQISYDYTVGVTNRFKGLDLIDRVPEELWMEVHNIVQKVVTKTIPKKRKCKKQSDCLRRSYKQLRKEVKGKGERERYTPLNADSQEEGSLACCSPRSHKDSSVAANRQPTKDQ